MIYFDEKKHSYTNVKTNEKYISATTLIGKFKKPFDVDKHSKRVAEEKVYLKKKLKKGGSK